MNTNTNTAHNGSEIDAAYAEIHERGNKLTLEELIAWDQKLESRWGKVRSNGKVGIN